MGILRLSHVEVCVDDLVLCAAYYVEVLGLIEVARESDRVYGGDPIAYWMTSPLLHFEPPAIAVHRFWAGLVRLAEAWSFATRIVCSVNSGPMRAFATSALGCDLGEPHNTEEVRVRLQSTLREARVTYRDHARDVEVPSIIGYPNWDGF